MEDIMQPCLKPIWQSNDYVSVSRTLTHDFTDLYTAFIELNSFPLIP